MSDRTLKWDKAYAEAAKRKGSPLNYKDKFIVAGAIEEYCGARMAEQSPSTLIGKLELLKEYTGPYGIETPGQAIDRCIAIVRDQSGEIPLIDDAALVEILGNAWNEAKIHDCSPRWAAFNAIKPYLKREDGWVPVADEDVEVAIAEAIAVIEPKTDYCERGIPVLGT